MKFQTETVRMTAWLFIILFLLQSCLSESEKGQIIHAEANPSKGFCFPCFQHIPDEVSFEKELVMIIEPNNIR